MRGPPPNTGNSHQQTMGLGMAVRLIRVLSVRSPLINRLQLCPTRRTVEILAALLVTKFVMMRVVLLCKLGEAIRVFEKFPMLRTTVRRSLT